MLGAGRPLLLHLQAGSEARSRAAVLGSRMRASRISRREPLCEFGRRPDHPRVRVRSAPARASGPPKDDDELYPDWGLNGQPALFNGEEARGLTETYVLKI